MDLRGREKSHAGRAVLRDSLLADPVFQDGSCLSTAFASDFLCSLLCAALSTPYNTWQVSILNAATRTVFILAVSCLK